MGSAPNLLLSLSITAEQLVASKSHAPHHSRVRKRKTAENTRVRCVLECNWAMSRGMLAWPVLR